MTFSPDVAVCPGRLRPQASPARPGNLLPACGNGWLPAFLRALGLLSLLLVLTAFPDRVQAECYYDSGSPATIAFSPPPTITVSTATAVNTVLWESPVAKLPSSPYLELDCYSKTNGGIVNTVAGQPSGGDDSLFPTNLPWLSYRILHPDTSSPLHADEPVSAGFGGSTISFSVASKLQLVVTAPVTYGGSLSVQLGVCQSVFWQQGCTRQYRFGCSKYEWQSSNQLATFTTSAVAFVVPGCTVAVEPTAVILPTVKASNFHGVDSTAGQTPFDVKLTCSGSTDLAITLATGSPATGISASATGVIAPTSGQGMAQGIGVQIRDGNGGPITFGTAIPAGTTLSGPYAVHFQARYYQTDATISGGSVSAMATYTLTYQ